MRSFPYTLTFAALAPAASAQFGPVTTIYSSPLTTLAGLVDVDGDGTRDLVMLESQPGNTQFNLRWSRGNAATGFEPSQPIATVPGALSGWTTESTQVDGGDLDGDGSVDLVVATTQGLVLLDGLPGNAFAAPRTISPGACGHTQVVDLDQDGDLDVVKGGFVGPTPPMAPSDILFINDGAGMLTPLAVPGTCCFYEVPVFTDADLDGDLDMVLAANSQSTPEYFENLGGVNFANPVGIAQLGPSALLTLADVDQDGDEDLLYAYFGFSPGGWIENNGGSFVTNHVVAAITASLSAPRADDMDGDGDMDFVFVQDLLGTSWYPNDGNNLFPEERPVGLPIVNASIVGLVDLNGDRALDILFSSDNPRGIAAYGNQGGLGSATCTANANSTGGPAELRASGSRSVGLNQFAVTLRNAPSGEFAAFLVGRSTQISTLPGSAGLLCLGAPFGIFRGPGQIRQTDPGGSVLAPIDLTRIPAGPGFHAVQGGETWIFQALFRDTTPLGGSNLSPAVAVTFVP